MLECSFLIPLVRNSDKKPHPPITWRVFQDVLRKTFPKGHSGPTTVFHDVESVPGEWLDEEKQEHVQDQSRKYTIALPDDQIDTLRSFLKKAANSFDQEEIYLSVAGSVEFVIATPNDGFLEDSIP